jgi:chromosome segregation ATPase
MEGRVTDFEILSNPTVDRHRKGNYGPSIDTADRLSSLAEECADILENFTTKTSDILSSLQMQSSTTFYSTDYALSADAALKDNDSILKAKMEQEMITEIEQKKLHLRQLEQALEACNASIELLKNDITSLELAMEERNQSNYELLTEIQTKMRMLTKRLEDGSNEIRALSEEMKDWSSKEQLLLKARHSRGISFIK